MGRRNQPVRLEPARSEEPRVMTTENRPALDGFTRLSQADRETGIRQPVGGRPVWTGPGYEDC
jgi:hypothetical protein